MKKMNRFLFSSFVLAVVCVFAVSGPAGAYSENFDVVGTSGNPNLPSGWSLWVYGTTDLSATWVSSITSSDVNLLTQALNQTAVSSLNDSATLSSTSNTSRWFNIAHSTTTSDRLIATSPTSNAGMAFQWAITNSGSATNQIDVNYQISKFYNGTAKSGVTPQNETMPGYQLWYQIGSTSGTWYNVSPLNLTLTELPKGTLGQKEFYTYTTPNTLIDLYTTWGEGATLNLRWVDDNAAGISPDQIIGLNNVNVSAVPIPAAAWLLGTGLVGLVALRRRKK